MRFNSWTAAGSAFAVVLLNCGAAQAAEVTALLGNGLTAIMSEVGPRFERATGHKLVIRYDAAGALKRRIESGEAFDVVIAPAGIDDLIKQGKVVANTRAPIARADQGVAVRAGAPKPDISSVDAFKRTLLNAKSIAYGDEGATRVYLENLFQRLGIAAEMKAKTKLQKGGHVTQAVADGEAELGFTFISNILPVLGAELAGPIPGALESSAFFTAAIATGAKEPEAAKALIEFLRAPEAGVVMKDKGMERIAP